MKNFFKIESTIILVFMLSLMLKQNVFAANSSMQDATNYSLGTTQTGSIAEEQEYYYYKFTLPSSGRINIQMTADTSDVCFQVYDSDDVELTNALLSSDEETNSATTNNEYDLTKGTYYYRIQRCDGASKPDGIYQFKITFTSSNETYVEVNGGTSNILGMAFAIQFNQTYIGQLAINDSKDFYKIQIPNSQNLVLNLYTEMKSVDVKIYDSNENEFWNTRLYCNSTSSVISYTNNEIAVSAGTYYIAISDVGYNGNYSFSIGAYYNVENVLLNSTKKTLVAGNSFSLNATLNPTNATNQGLTWYSSDETVAKVSQGVVTTYKAGVAEIKVVSDANKEAIATCKVVVKPQKVKLKKVKRYSSKRNKKGFKATYSVKKGTSGFQVAYSKNKKFKKGVKKTYTYYTSFTKAGLKKGKYYVRVRAYTWDNNKRVYGEWSNVKSISVK